MSGDEKESEVTMSDYYTYCPTVDLIRGVIIALAHGITQHTNNAKIMITINRGVNNFINVAFHLPVVSQDHKFHPSGASESLLFSSCSKSFRCETM